MLWHVWHAGPLPLESARNYEQFGSAKPTNYNSGYVLTYFCAFQEPLWEGGELAGETIFVHSEQGFGDFFQFVRYIPLVIDLGGKVIL